MSTLLSTVCVIELSWLTWLLSPLTVCGLACEIGELIELSPDEVPLLAAEGVGVFVAVSSPPSFTPKLTPRFSKYDYALLLNLAPSSTKA